MEFKKIEGSLEDSGWEFDPTHSIRSRGISDYKRTVKFDHKLSPEELKGVCAWLQENDPPGWTPVFARKDLKLQEGIYVFCTTWDSSD